MKQNLKISTETFIQLKIKIIIENNSLIMKMSASLMIYLLFLEVYSILQKIVAS